VTGHQGFRTELSIPDRPLAITGLHDALLRWEGMSDYAVLPAVRRTEMTVTVTRITQDAAAERQKQNAQAVSSGRFAFGRKDWLREPAATSTELPLMDGNRDESGRPAAENNQVNQQSNHEPSQRSWFRRFPTSSCLRSTPMTAHGSPASR